MARGKTYKSEEIIRLVDEFRIENPSEKITIPNFGKYIRKKDMDIQDHTLRRDKEFRNYLEAINKGAEQEIENDLVTYKTIDIDSFLEKNRTKDKLKEAIVIRDRYYANIAARAAEAFKERRKLQKRVEELEAEIESLKENLSAVQAKADNADIKLKNNIISKLRAILNSYVYPDVANAILQKEGILDVMNCIVPDEIIEDKTIKVDTEIKTSKYDAVNNILEGFDD